MFPNFYISFAWVISSTNSVQLSFVFNRKFLEQSERENVRIDKLVVE